MQQNENLIELLNDLIQINNDRVNGYQKAIDELKEDELNPILHKMIQNSRKNLLVLSEHVVKLGGVTTNTTTVAGKIYRVWMDVKAVFTGHDAKSILASCVFGEEAAQTAYESALNSEDLKDIEITNMLKYQKANLSLDMEKVKSLSESILT
jgi:uncharacterized protein (TIGR02284 family)